MKLRLTVVAAVAVTAMAGLAASAGAAPKHDGCPVGPGQGGNTGNSAWELMTKGALIDAILEDSGGDPEDVEALVEKNDKNGDGDLCALKQVLPPGASVFYVFRDNTANASS